MAIAKILSELSFFLGLALLSEIARFLAVRAAAKQATVQALYVCSLVCSWYSVSITLTLYNKWVVSSSQEGGLQFPIFYTMTHMLLKGFFSLSYLVCVRQQPLPRSSAKVIVGTSLVGLLTALDVAASNLSFVYISVSYFTMLKSASLIFILALGALTCMERCSVGICSAVLTIAAGICLASWGEVAFNLKGFCLVIASELFAAMRWIMTQMVLHDGNLDAMVAVFFMAPAATTALVPLVVLLERDKVDVLDRPGDAAQCLLMVLFPGFLAFILLLVEVQLVKETSALSLSVFGNLKAVVTVIFAILVFGDKASPVQWVGLAAALGGMLAYSYAKKQSLAVDAIAGLGYKALAQDEGTDDVGIPLPAVLAAMWEPQVLGRPVGTMMDAVSEDADCEAAHEHGKVVSAGEHVASRDATSRSPAAGLGRSYLMDGPREPSEEQPEELEVEAESEEVAEAEDVETVGEGAAAEAEDVIAEAEEVEVKAEDVKADTNALKVCVKVTAEAEAMEAHLEARVAAPLDFEAKLQDHEVSVSTESHSLAGHAEVGSAGSFATPPSTSAASVNQGRTGKVRLARRRSASAASGRRAAGGGHTSDEVVHRRHFQAHDYKAVAGALLQVRPGSRLRGHAPARWPAARVWLCHAGFDGGRGAFPARAAAHR